MLTVSNSEREKLRRLIARNHGNISAMVKDLRNGSKISRQGLAYRLGLFGLLEEAEQARAIGKIGGRRPSLVGACIDPVAEKREMIRIIKEHKGRQDQARALGFSERVFYRKLKFHQISAK